MNDKLTHPLDRFIGVAIYLIGFLIFLLWLQPLLVLEAVAYGDVLILFSVVVFLLSFMRLPALISFVFKLIASIFVLDTLYLSSPIFTSAWLSELLGTIQINIEALVSRDLEAVTPLGEMTLILLLIMTVSYLMYYWLVSMRRVFVFSVLTLIYLTVMDTFTAYDLQPMLLVVLVLTISLLIFNAFRKKFSQNTFKLTVGQFITRLLFPLVLVVTLCTLAFDYLPIREPIWPDPVPFLTNNFSGGEGERRIGYGEDDSVLGGSLSDNDELVFTASIEQPNYWRVDSKEIYTGLGWERLNDPAYEPYQSDVALSAQSANIYYSKETNFNRVPFPYLLQGIALDERSYQFDPSIGLFNGIDTSENQTVEIYYDQPAYDQVLLNQLSMPYTESLDPVYLQLPGRLPERVHQLANEIKGEETNPYLIALSIERYFKQSGFLYQTEAVEVAQSDEDYVDQFLFESRSGYCDNFSTSMVVMLRSVGIPSRWVKGFNKGTRDSEGHYEVRQNNAHSWVEVYFEGIGWMPFEPTVGFSSPRTVISDEEESTEDESSLDDEQPIEDESNLDEIEEREEIAPEDGGVSNDSHWFDWRMAITVFGIISSVLVVLLALFWRRILLYVMVKRYLPIETKEDVSIGMKRLLWLLSKKAKRLRTETLKQYGTRLDESYQTSVFSQLFREYEAFLYGELTDQQRIQSIEKFYLFVLETILS